MMDYNQNQLTIRTYMAIMAERDGAIQERNMCLEDRKRALAERDMAMLQRDAAIAERNSAIQERDKAIVALRLLECSLTETTTVHADKETDPVTAEVAYTPRQNLTGESDSFGFAEVAPGTANPKKARQMKESKQTKSAKLPRVAEGAAEGLRRPLCPATSHGHDNGHCTSEDEQDRQPDMSRDNTSPKRIIFDESVMPTPVCTCTGSPQPCYRWGSGGWQSACCTTAISMYPLPQVSNKRYTRVGGRKMSGNAFTKLLNRLASEGYDLSTPLDLKDHWAKHGTNRYTTAK